MNKDIEKKITKIVEKIGLHNNTWNSDVTKEPVKAILALLTSEVEKERERLLKEVEECLGGDVTPVANDFSKEGEAYTRGYNDRLSDIRKAIKQCIK